MAGARELSREFILVLEALERAVGARWEIRQAGVVRALDSGAAIFASRDAAYKWGVKSARAKGFVQIVTIDRDRGAGSGEDCP